MEVQLNIHNKDLIIDLSDPIDVSITLQATDKNPRAWYIDRPKIEPVKTDDWIGKVSEGGAVNFNNIYFNPHAHGTHTECVGHISEEFHSVNKALRQFFFLAELITVAPEGKDDDRIISAKQIKKLLGTKKPEAVVIRSLPNTGSKRSRDYAHTNWAYLSEDAAVFLRELGVKHLLIDLPSVDKEKDDGELLAHRAFWNYPKSPRFDTTITEFIFVPNRIKDGTYILNLQIAPFHNDASPSKPILYELKENEF